MVKRKANAVPRPNRDMLMAAAESAWDAVPEEVVHASCARMVERLKAVVHSIGGHFE